jgi:hypothetical protein
MKLLRAVSEKRKNPFHVEWNSIRPMGHSKHDDPTRKAQHFTLKEAP